MFLNNEFQLVGWIRLFEPNNWLTRLITFCILIWPLNYRWVRTDGPNLLCKKSSNILILLRIERSSPLTISIVFINKLI